MATLYAVAMLGLWVYGLNLLWLAVRQAWDERLEEGAPPDPDEVPTPQADRPAVTVQLPLYNEPRVAERVLDACACLDYPRNRLEIQVLDDSTDATTDIVERRVEHWQRHGLDVALVHRDHRDGFKAGALHNGLRLARGSLVAVFDADFVPQADFLRRLVPHFDDPQVGMVQARWGHLNGEDTLLSRLQATGLDVHFALEQTSRSRTGCFINFNGTAGLWRRACIDDAGGWQDDTLTEDLDLSYRAQLRGWRFRYVPQVEVPAELPPTLDALRTQQFRWAKGAVETARKLLGRLWRSDQPARVRIEGTLHLTAHFAFPCILLAALLHAPLVAQAELGAGPGRAYFAVMALGLVGFAGFVLAQVLAQRALYPDWPGRLLRVPLFVTGSMGLALSNTWALVLALAGRRTAFVRTPKGGTTAGSTSSSSTSAIVPWLEVALAVYAAGGLVVLVTLQAWAALPFQALFVVGFSLASLDAIESFKKHVSSYIAMPQRLASRRMTRRGQK